MNLLLATSNVGKIAEIRGVLSDLPIKFFSLSDFPGIEQAEETGSTYEENATIKAESYARQSGIWALADDSGLEVTALGGAPGVFSARFGGAGLSDADRIAFLLSQLAREGGDNRSARFVSVIALADKAASVVEVVEGTCEGQIIDAPRGVNGFGYDPIFMPNGFDQTFAELPADVKNAISHRAKALKAMRDSLKNSGCAGV